MRLGSRTSWIVAGVAALALVGTGAGASRLCAQEKHEDEDDDEDEDAGNSAATQKVAEEAMAKAVARGKELWNDKTLFRKPCAACHDDKDKPKLNMATRAYSYPAYNARTKSIVTMQQKIQLMITNNSRGKALDPAGTDIAALAAYIVSLRKK